MAGSVVFLKKIKYIKSTDNENNSEFNFKQILKGVLISAFISICFLVVAAIVLTYTNISLGLAEILSSIVFYIGALLCGLIAGLGAKYNGWIHGLIAGIMYVCLILLVSISVNIKDGGFAFPFLKIIVSCILGCVGGITGVNVPIRKVKRY